ncbi:SusC/RagA family TonB-linked outer membrane protein [Chitinophaga sedimenti]|uniref:SusC/RagA family TonB-linked outer membrane protein n=1 Tax=Chitinophaga sedimenti TaxID=2033606 RepID=UPI002002DD5C|nr:SusC/RagA family TonB-linked outer membrane protein [Chitinophaga sedimenti]MCK7557272.1 SusC/RagA family TonB-linked outer membrane protein [Chitinophaga sedimenti]
MVQGKTIILSWKKLLPATAVVEAAPVADSFIVRGKVVDESGRPVPSVSVVLPGTPFGTLTEGDGTYVLRNAEKISEVVFSYVGYETVRERLNGRQRLNITLKQSASGLGETVVIGYGTTTKTRNTGSISSVSAEEIAKQPIANPLNALQGRVAGALVTQSNGLPGSRVTIVVRGLNTLDATGAGSQPLYIVDGIPFMIQDGQTPVTNDLNGRGAYGAAGGVSPFSIINPAEIERIDILKDADATAIYGTRGANGVVLITTKKGKAGKTKVDVNVYRGAGTVGHFIPMMNNRQYRDMRYEGFRNDGIVPTAANAPDLLVWDSTKTNDWQRKYLGGTANTTDAQVTVSGGDSRTRVLMNAGYHKETTVFPGDYDDYRISARTNIDHNSLDQKFNANISANYSYGVSDMPTQDFSTIYNFPANLPLYDSTGKLAWVGNFRNPESYRLQKYIAKTHNLMANAMLRYTIFRGLDIKTSFGYNNITMDQNMQLPALSKSPLSGVPTNSAQFTNLAQRSYILEPQITYNGNIGKGRLSALLGSTFQHSLNTSLRQDADNYSTPLLLGALAGAGTYGTPATSYTLYRYTSVFGRATYDWDSRYILNAVVRRDGSSRFGPDRRFGNFWSFGAAWVFSGEEFSKSLPWLSFGKLRASYGLTGNDQIGDYLYRTLYTASNSYQNGAAVSPNRINNPTLQWQNTYKTEVGLELGFLRNNIQVTANYYHNRTPNQLGFLTMATQAGFNSYSANFDALIQNTGFELELNTVNIRTEKFRWTTAFNITVPRTKVVRASKSYFFYNDKAIGQQLSYAMRFKYMGVDPQTGRPLYADMTKDSLTFTPNFSADRHVAGYTAPKAYGGLNNTFSYQHFDLSFFLHFSFQDGNVLPTAAPGALASGNVPTYWLDRWQQAGDKTSVPRYSSATTIYSSWSSSDAIFGNTSFLRLRNVNVGYRLPSEWAKKIKTDNLRVYLQGQNLAWISKQKYVYDPETGTSMPPLRVITVGLNVTL